jgi:hypothetical protein
MTEPLVIEHGSSGAGRWLRERRFRFALWIAVVEGIVVAIEPHVSRWTVILLAIAAVALYYWVGRRTSSGTLHELAWIAGASQLLAVAAVILAFILFWTALILVAIFAVVALAFLFFDRR